MDLINTTVGELLFEQSIKNGSNIGLKYKEREYSWKEVLINAEVYATYFIKNNIGLDDYVGILGKNCPEYIFAFLGLSLIGAVPVLINAGHKYIELKDIFSQVSFKAFIYEDVNKDNSFKEMVDFIKIQDCAKDTLFINLHLINNKDNINYKCKSSELACILFTSGTTGRAKGVMLTQRGVVNNAIEIARLLDWKSDDVLLLTVPLFHCFGVTASLIASLWSGFKIIIMDTLRSKHILELIEKEKVTILNGVPSVFLFVIEHNEIENYDLSTLKSGIVAGSPISEEEYLYIVESLDIDNLLQSYGQTETSPCVTMSITSDTLEKKSNNVGKAVNGVKVRVVDDKGKPILNSGEIGQIEVSGYNVMKGYLNSDKMYREGDWLSTGDYGYLDKEGYLYICGRKKDVLIRGGENISTYEIARVIKQLYFIKEVRVVAVPDKIMHEEIGVLVSLKKEVKNYNEIIFEYLKDRLADYKLPRVILKVKDIPLNESGKYDDRKITNMLIKELNKNG